MLGMGYMSLGGCTYVNIWPVPAPATAIERYHMKQSLNSKISWLFSRAWSGNR